MRKLLLSGFCLLALGMSSCTITYHGVTNNSVGTKEGVAKSSVFSSDVDYSYSSAAKNGNIQKIGTTKYVYGFFSVQTKITGE